MRVLLRSDEGYLVANGSGVGLAERTGDSGVWCWEGGGILVNALESGTVVKGAAALEGTDFTEPVLCELSQGTFVAEPAPDKLPSECLRCLRECGHCQFERVISPAAIDTIKKLVHATLDAAGIGDNLRPTKSSSLDYLERSALFYQMHFHPVVMWVLENFFGSPWIRAAHPPVPRVAEPGSGPGDWHNDTPYQQLMQRGYDAYSMPFPNLPLGVQANVCVDDYYDANGGTMYATAICHATPHSCAIDNHLYLPMTRALFVKIRWLL